MTPGECWQSKVSFFKGETRGMARDRGLPDGHVQALVGLGGGNGNTSPLTGTKALMLAVMEDALRAFLGAEMRAREEAESWMFGPHPRSVFSFVVVCETLGLEPKAVRAALRGMRTDANGTVVLPRSRPNARGSRAVGLDHYGDEE